MQGPKWPFILILIVYGPCVVIVNLLGQVCTLGRASRTKETQLDFCEWYRGTLHPRVFYGLTGCQRTPRFRGFTLFAGSHCTAHASEIKQKIGNNITFRSKSLC